MQAGASSGPARAPSASPPPMAAAARIPPSNAAAPPMVQRPPLPPQDSFQSNGNELPPSSPGDAADYRLESPNVAKAGAPDSNVTAPWADSSHIPSPSAMSPTAQSPTEPSQPLAAWGTSSSSKLLAAAAAGVGTAATTQVSSAAASAHIQASRAPQEQPAPRDSIGHISRDDPPPAGSRSQTPRKTTTDSGPALVSGSDACLEGRL